MSIIRLLDQQTANSIAAGEVVERPASVIKELVENSLDAGATTVSVEISGGGILSMAVNDNGRGMDAADARLAFARHATSKIRVIEDLDTIGTLGFRGEALASIAAVSRVTLRTRQSEAADGYEVRIEGGQLVHEGPAGSPQGTTIRVEQLFYNTPARFKFLKKDSSEAAAVAETMERLVLSRPDVSFRLLNNGQEVLHSPGNNDLLSAIYAVYGRKQAALCIPVAGHNGPVRISGFVARPEGARNNRAGQTVLVNGRIIRAKAVTAAIDESFKTRLMKGRFAFAVLRIDLPQELVDVNVHPQKLEVRFWKDSEIFTAVHQSILSSLIEHGGVAETPDEMQSKSSLQHQDVKTTDEFSGTSRPPFTQTELPLGDTLADRSRAWTAENGHPGQPAAVPDDPLPRTDDRSDRLSQDSQHLDGKPYGAAAGRASGWPLREAGASGWPLREAGANGLPMLEAGAKPASPDAADDAAGGQSTRIPAPAMAAGHGGLLKAADLSQGRVIGQLFRTYILIEWQDELILVDQHAAHEKILYESLRDAWRRRQNPRVQPLLVPLTMTVTAGERILFEAEQAFFEALGFTLEPFGNNGLVIRTLPDLDDIGLDAEAAVRTALQALQGARRTELDAIAGKRAGALESRAGAVPAASGSDPAASGSAAAAAETVPAAVDEALYQMACKAAVKAHDRLNPAEIDRLIADLSVLENPYTCPHGRPVIIRTPRLELEKKFKRVL